MVSAIDSLTFDSSVDRPRSRRICISSANMVSSESAGSAGVSRTSASSSRASSCLRMSATSPDCASRSNSRTELTSRTVAPLGGGVSGVNGAHDELANLRRRIVLLFESVEPRLEQLQHIVGHGDLSDAFEVESLRTAQQVEQCLWVLNAATEDSFHLVAYLARQIHCSEVVH